MNYELEFDMRALKEWRALDSTIREQFKRHLARRLENPHVPASRLRGADMGNTYKIKLRGSGFRLVYEVYEHRLVVLVFAVAKREKDQVCRSVEERKARTR